MNNGIDFLDNPLVALAFTIFMVVVMALAAYILT